MPQIISVPRVVVGEELIDEEIIEETFAALTDSAKHKGVQLLPVLGLMYLPQEILAEKFRESCKDIINALKVHK